MKRLFVAIVLLFALSFIFAGCGMSAEDIIKEAMRASKDEKTATFEILQTTKLPRAPIKDGKIMPQNLVQNATGMMDLSTGDAKMTTELVSGVSITMLQLGDKQYWQLAGNWYDVPKEKQAVQSITEALSVSQYLKYFKELKKLGDASIDGQDCYHIRAIPDMKQLIKLPGITDLLKDPQGKQIRTVDEIAEMKALFDFYIMKSNFYIKKQIGQVKYRAGEDFIKNGYAEAGDMIETKYEIVFSNFDRRLNLQAPANPQPLPVAPQG